MKFYLIYVFMVGFSASFFLTSFVANIGERDRFFKKPKDLSTGRSCLGGIAIFTAFLIAILSASFLKDYFEARIIRLILPSVIIILLGIFDDAKELRPFTKIMVELIVALLLVKSGIVTKISFVPSWVNLGITILWVVFIVNAFNLLDIVDGLASGLVIIISTTLLVIAVAKRDLFSGTILIALIASHIGFLRYNYPPARIYMGDTGSLFSGFLLSATTISISYAPAERPVALITPLIAISLPVYDTLFLIIMRLKKGVPIFNKSRDHFTLRLIAMGYSIRKSIWVMYLFCILLGISALLVAFGTSFLSIITIGIVMLMFVFIGRIVAMVNVR